MGQIQLPTGIVTFLLTDVEGSTRLWQQHEDVMDDVVSRHDELIAQTVSDNGGVLLKSKGEGDSTFSVFGSPADALVAALEVQRGLSREDWSGGVTMRARAALHTGSATLREGDYYASVVNRCARLRAIVHGGQVVCSQATEELVRDELPVDVKLIDLGSHGLRDLERPERVYQIHHPDLDADFPPLRSSGSARTNLPSTRTTFIGREEEVQLVRRHLSENRLVTLTGVGGCGKTRLAIQAGAEELEHFDGVYFCDLAPVADAAVVPSQVSQALGMSSGGPMSPATRPVREEIIDYLIDRSVLLVLDNCEHLIEICADLVDDLLNRCPGLKVLATSREALEVDGERAYTVPSLALPSEGSYEGEAVFLFSDRALAVSPNFELNDETGVQVAEICRRLDGIPLAIELAAAQASVLTPAQINERLNDRFRLLSGGRRRVQRQQTLAATLDWSYELLGSDEQALLRRLAVFPQPFTLEQAEGICAGGLTESVAMLMRSLQAKSLVVTVEATDGRRYRLLETVRLYAEQKLLEAGEADDLRTGHRDYFLAWLESFDAESSFGMAVTLEVMHELDHIRAALVWSDDQGRPDLLARMVPRGYLAWANDLTEPERWIANALEAPDLPDDVRLPLLVAGSWGGILSLHFPNWRMRAEEASALPADRDGFFHGMAQGFLSMYWAANAYMLGDAQAATRAREHARLALEAPRTVFGGIMATTWVGMAYVGLGDLDESARTLERVVEVDLEPGEEAIVGSISCMLGVVEHLRGDLQAAFRYMERAAEIFLNDEWGTSLQWGLMWRSPYGAALTSVGRYAEGVAYMRSIAREMRETGSALTFIPIVLGSIGIMAAMRGLNECAARLIVRGYEGPLTPLDHRIMAMYMEPVRDLLPPEVYERCCAEGRSMSFAEASEMGLSELEDSLTSAE